MSGTNGPPIVMRPIAYPETDGQPIAENTLQFRWIVTIQGGLDALFANDPNVFVAGDLLWYPVEGEPTIRQAPDAMVVFGRPKGDRGSYLQWLEEGIAPQVVFEVLSPGNRAGEMQRKLAFYERHGVDEYYIYDPDNGKLSGWQRVQGKLEEIPQMKGWISPRLKVRFDVEGIDLCLKGPDGRRFVHYLELAAQRQEAEERQHKAETQQRKAEKQRQKAEKERLDLDQKRLQAERTAEALRAQLKALGVDPEA